MRSFTDAQVCDIAFRHGQDLIAFHPPRYWGRVWLPRLADSLYERHYVRGLAKSYKGDLSPRCTICGYNLDDCVTHGDHSNFCAGTIPNNYHEIITEAYA